MQVKHLACSLSNKQVFKVECLLIECNEGVFADGAHFDDFREFAATFHHFEYDGGNQYFGFLSGKRDLNLFLGFGAQSALRTNEMCVSVSKDG